MNGGNLISVVTTCFNEEENIRPFYGEVTAALEDMKSPWEIIFVENGSGDDSYGAMQEIAAKDPRVKIVRLSRNFGYQGGLTAGLSFASGRDVVIMDVDLQDPPETLKGLLRTKREGGWDVVYGVRAAREGSRLKRAAYRYFYWLLSRLAENPIPENAGDFAVMDRKVLRAILQMEERQRFLRGLRAFAGFRQTGVPYKRVERKRGKSKFPWRAMILLAFDGIFAFSRVPLRFMIILGLMIIGCSFLFSLYNFMLKVFALRPYPEGIPVIIQLVLFFGGLHLLFLGIVGEYVGRIYEEVKRRPVAIVSGLTNIEPDQRDKETMALLQLPISRVESPPAG